MITNKSDAMGIYNTVKRISKDNKIDSLQINLVHPDKAFNSGFSLECWYDTKTDVSALVYMLNEFVLDSTQRAKLCIAGDCNFNTNNLVSIL